MSSQGNQRPSAPPSGATGPHAPRRPSPSGGGSSTALLVAAIALAVAAVSMVVAGLSLIRGDGDPCRTTAWAAVPAVEDLPDGWAISSTQVVVDGLGVTVAGPPAADSGESPAVYLTVTCYGDDATAAIDLSREAAETAGEAVTDGPDVGDDGYAIEDPTAGVSVIHFRRGPLVAYATTSGTVAAEDAGAIALALDGAIAIALDDPVARTAPSTSPEAPAGESPDPSAAVGESPAVESPAGETSPSPSEAAPELVAMLPTAVAGTPLSRDSATGTMVLADDSMSRALAATIRTLGASVDDLQVAQAYDETGTLDAYLLAFRLPGFAAADLAPAILETWLAAGAAGVTTTDGTVGGKAVTTVAYGDEGASAYVYRTGEAVIVLETGDPALAATILALLP